MCPVQGNRVMRQGTRAGKAVWVHVTCALWVPEVFFENCEKLQNVTGTKQHAPWFCEGVGLTQQ